MPMSSSGHDDDPPERLAQNPIGVGTTANTRRVKKKRVRNFTDDDRAAHRIFEKSRREAFKEALIVRFPLLHLRLLSIDERVRKNLASLLPALADTEPQRLSKHVVVDESITVIRSQHEQIKTMTECLKAVETERDELLAELGHWRNGAGIIELQQANTLVHHGDTSATAKAMLGAVPTALQPTESQLNVIGEAAPSFITNPLHEPNPPPISTDANAGVHWEGFDQQIHAFANHVHGENGPDDIGNAESSQLNTYQTPRSPDMSQFNMERGQQHGVVFLPFESPQSFDPRFQADTFMQNTAPLQDYIPP
ncbi:hypothetical protein FHL15_001872 [Xylaria flabelliformis]|uniref:BHLH domain-containing protein n=1 Tax=Xylaria flabelliformis TaxID=2512241 RepID=A0A553IA51_9PEZI|nr:hypothetical protein FHL15_001872 [Xylaria flabelliformis]